ncbi:MAG: MBL fold metallo-hydrolase [Treponema sp.]|jgi:glyoxylase-like metal-dependent hydrolase (beta-lactamase superfamily II)|nr:MBL fold metallo-hydrolase [Treponema sp.]
MESKFFSSRQIAPRTALIRGTCGENAYLLEGDVYALLIDTLTGAGNLRAFCRELTDMPIHPALTHGHADHAGGCFDFGLCSIHPDDIRYLYRDTSVEHRKEHIERHNRGASFVQWRDFTPPGALKTYPIYDGDIFDLGGRIIEVIGVPGHSLGSVVFLDRTLGLVFSGDACNTNTLLYLDGATSIPVYREGLLRWNQRQGEFSALWGGHDGEALPPRVIGEAVSLCERILEGSDDGEERGFYRAPFRYARRRDRDDGMLANIGYRRDWIRQTPPYRMAPLPRTAPEGACEKEALC